jgi:hypothetical protein
MAVWFAYANIRGMAGADAGVLGNVMPSVVASELGRDPYM